MIDGFFSQASWAFAGILHLVGLLRSVVSALNGDYLLALLEFLGVLAYCYAVLFAFPQQVFLYRCRFCSKLAYFKIYRHRDSEQVIDEIEYLIDEFGTKVSKFQRR